jgi:hypothetical protein
VIASSDEVAVEWKRVGTPGEWGIETRMVGSIRRH